MVPPFRCSPGRTRRRRAHRADAVGRLQGLQSRDHRAGGLRYEPTPPPPGDPRAADRAARGAPKAPTRL